MNEEVEVEVTGTFMVTLTESGYCSRDEAALVTQEDIREEIFNKLESIGGKDCIQVEFPEDFKITIMEIE